MIKVIENLFIIGNGFDLGHKMNTSYKQFKNWLVSQFPEAADTASFYLSEAQIMPDGEEYICDEDLASFLIYCIDETTGGNWADFESALGKIEWEYFFDELEDIKDRDGDINLWKTAYAREDLTRTLSVNSGAFSQFFSKWISTIRYPDSIVKNPFFTSAIKDTSFFLTFNYTKTLEDVYLISENQICHIHGVQGEKIIFGHGNRHDQDESKYDFGMEGIDDVHEALRKPTEKVIRETDVFDKLKSFAIKNIYSWGFSFSKVDQCYLEEICKNLDTKLITWYIHDHSKDKFGKFAKILCACGFKGRVKLFRA